MARTNITVHYTPPNSSERPAGRRELQNKGHAHDWLLKGQLPHTSTSVSPRHVRSLSPTPQRSALRSASIPISHTQTIVQAFPDGADLYADVLKIPSNASSREIRVAYFRMGRKTLLATSQVDAKDEEQLRSLQQRFQAMSFAYEILSSKSWKQEYDESGLPTPKKGISWNESVEELLFQEHPGEAEYRRASPTLDEFDEDPALDDIFLAEQDQRSRDMKGSNNPFVRQLQKFDKLAALVDDSMGTLEDTWDGLVSYWSANSEPSVERKPRRDPDDDGEEKKEDDDCDVKPFPARSSPPRKNKQSKRKTEPILEEHNEEIFISFPRKNRSKHSSSDEEKGEDHSINDEEACSEHEGGVGQRSTAHGTEYESDSANSDRETFGHARHTLDGKSPITSIGDVEELEGGVASSRVVSPEAKDLRRRLLATHAELGDEDFGDDWSLPHQSVTLHSPTTRRDDELSEVLDISTDSAFHINLQLEPEDFFPVSPASAHSGGSGTRDAIFGILDVEDLNTDTGALTEAFSADPFAGLEFAPGEESKVEIEPEFVAAPTPKRRGGSCLASEGGTLSTMTPSVFTEVDPIPEPHRSVKHDSLKASFLEGLPVVSETHEPSSPPPGGTSVEDFASEGPRGPVSTINVQQGVSSAQSVLTLDETHFLLNDKQSKVPCHQDGDFFNCVNIYMSNLQQELSLFGHTVATNIVEAHQAILEVGNVMDEEHKEQEERILSRTYTI